MKKRNKNKEYIKRQLLYMHTREKYFKKCFENVNKINKLKNKMIK